MRDALGRDNERFGLRCEDPSLTVQSDAIDADINEIMRRFGVTGGLPANLEYVTNVDLAEAPDTFTGATDILRRARDSFMELPAAVRARFDNDPALFMDFCSVPDNLDEMRKMGLAVPKSVVVDPVNARVDALDVEDAAVSRRASRAKNPRV